ncbi:hypothetical protein BGZ57DRAFT_359914 [Hyaloscypha finlandica]|nr:hypothetical protein BGZ57DRAFT_359914 [Hyaloscypha finlandica]
MPCLLACLLACLPSLPCPPSLAFPAFRHSVNLQPLLLVPCTVCTATRLQAMSPVLAPFGPNSVATAKAPPHSQIRGQEPSPPSPPAMPSHFKPLQAPSSPSQSGLPSSIDTTKLCPFEAAALAFLCLCCVISLPCSEAHVGPCWPCWAMLGHAGRMLALADPPSLFEPSAEEIWQRRTVE